MRILLLAVAALIASSSMLQAAPPKGASRGDRPNREELHKKILEKFDANKNGKIDEKEKAAIKAAFAKRVAARKKAAAAKGGECPSKAKSCPVKGKADAKSCPAKDKADAKSCPADGKGGDCKEKSCDKDDDEPQKKERAPRGKRSGRRGR